MQFLPVRGEKWKQEKSSSSTFQKLKGTAAVCCLLVGTMPAGAMGFQAAPAAQTQPDGAQQTLPGAPPPNFTQPLFMRPGNQDFAKPRGYFPNPLRPYEAVTVPPPNLLNSLHLNDLVKDGKIYLSLGDAVLLALQNNYDIAIQRVNLNIADTDLLRARAGSSLLGVSAGTVTGTIGGTGSTVSTGGGPGGTSTAAGGAGTGSGGLALSTNGGGTVPENLDPYLTGTIQLERQHLPPVSSFSATDANTNEYNFTYNQGFITGTALQVGFQNTRLTTNAPFTIYSPQLSTSFNAQVTQHLLQGFGWGVNGRFMVQAQNDRRIADSAFREQLLYTINQVENIYWGLVSSYEDLQAKQRAIDQSARLLSDDQKQLQIGTLAPLDVVNAQSQVASDQQALITSQSNLEYQQLVMKQAISRNLDDPRLANAPIIPTDRVSLLETPEEHTAVDDLVRQADANSPAVEQDILTLKNDELTLKGVKNGLLPQVDVYAFYGASAQGGAQGPNCLNFDTSGAVVPCPPNQYASVNYSTAFGNLFNGSSPNKGVGFNINIPIRNRTGQAEQARSMLEYRQAQMRLAQAYVQIHMNVINGQYALTNDRAAVKAALANRDYNRQSLDSEIKKLHLGASTTANVLQQQRNLATAENSVISTTARYAIDRANLAELLASTLDRYGISIADAATGTINTQPTIPGLEPAKQEQEVTVPAQQQQLEKQEQQPQNQEQPPASQPQPPANPPQQ
ncbi:TolC family protein [Paracidobacterium acidisoli]|uniref:TolC family protein n=1 Tax=Paracidobacterium acidisoli TaxID=2303751 RepID=A0A372ISR1_9BACT|nr:TolC family protein [Paracidobacterium acidisoli]MBT9330743.1 TolC family protein [Paracidobacterium acidisoli]